MITIGAIHSGATSMAPVLEKALKPLFTKFRLLNIIDDTLIHTVIKDGMVTEKTVHRVVDLAEALVLAGADVVVDTCSSIGMAAEIANTMLEKPVIRIDQGMVNEAVSHYRKIGLLASLSTTLMPTVDCVNATAARQGKTVEIVHCIADGAFQKWIEGNPAAHDDLCVEASKQLGDVEVILLAQASMMRVQERIAAETGKVVISSPDYFARYLREMFPDA